MTSQYRYTLTREVVPGRGGLLLWVMLNPSTADDFKDDQTIRKVKYFTDREGYGSLMVVNLFAARSTKPAGLLDMLNPTGPDNRVVVEDALAAADHVVFAWGDWLRANNAKRYGMGIPMMNVAGMARKQGHTPQCLGKTMHGSPKHPCYLPHGTQMEMY